MWWIQQAVRHETPSCLVDQRLSTVPGVTRVGAELCVPCVWICTAYDIGNVVSIVKPTFENVASAVGLWVMHVCFEGM